MRSHHDYLLFGKPARLHVHPLPGDGLNPFLAEFAGLSSTISHIGLAKLSLVEGKFTTDHSVNTLCGTIQSPRRAVVRCRIEIAVEQKVDATIQLGNRIVTFVGLQDI